MQFIATWTLAATLSIAPVSGGDLPPPIDVKCDRPGALDRALARAAKLGLSEVRLHGVCEGNFTIAAGTVTLHNSWGKSWGVGGECKVHWRDMEDLLDDAGDAVPPSVRTALLSLACNRGGRNAVFASAAARGPT